MTDFIYSNKYYKKPIKKIDFIKNFDIMNDKPYYYYLSYNDLKNMPFDDLASEMENFRALEEYLQETQKPQNRFICVIKKTIQNIKRMYVDRLKSNQ